MKLLMPLAVAMILALSGCGPDSELFPNAFEGSFIKTGIGPGPTGPVGPVSGHTFDNPTGQR